MAGAVTRNTGLPSGVVDEDVGGGRQAQPAAGHMGFGQPVLVAVVGADVTIHVEDADRLGVLGHPRWAARPWWKATAWRWAANSWSLRCRVFTSGTRSRPRRRPNSPGAVPASCSGTPHPEEGHAGQGEQDGLQAVEAGPEAAVHPLAHRQEAEVDQGGQGTEHPAPPHGLGHREAGGCGRELPGGGQGALGLAVDREPARAGDVLIAPLPRAEAAPGPGGPVQLAPLEGVAEERLAQPKGGGSGPDRAARVQQALGLRLLRGGELVPALGPRPVPEEARHPCRPGASGRCGNRVARCNPRAACSSLPAWPGPGHPVARPRAGGPAHPSRRGRRPRPPRSRPPGLRRGGWPAPRSLPGPLGGCIGSRYWVGMRASYMCCIDYYACLPTRQAKSACYLHHVRSSELIL